MTPSRDRKRLPDRRCHELLDFEHNGFCYTAGIGRFADGALTEVFLNAEKVGTAIETQARDAAITTSLFLQQGGSAEILRLALTRKATAARPARSGSCSTPSSSR
jgi:hypothetical protein